MTDAHNFPPLPELDDEWVMARGITFTVEQMQAYVLADRAARVNANLTDSEIKDRIDSIDFSQMVTADDLFYMIARAVLKPAK